MKMKKLSKKDKEEVVNSILERFKWHGVRMVFPYMNHSLGERRYVAIELKDLLKIMKWERTKVSPTNTL